MSSKQPRTAFGIESGISYVRAGLNDIHATRMPTDDILLLTSGHVSRLFGERHPSWARYHSLEHTRNTVEAVEEICRGLNLADHERELGMLAAWFHDVGYLDGAEGHEETSVGYATAFLRNVGYPEGGIVRIAGCIRATKMPQEPETLLEQVICDADLIHLGRKDFFERSRLLRLETEHRTGKQFTDEEWLVINIEFVTRYAFHTSYVRSKYSDGRLENLLKLQEELRTITTRRPH